MLIPSISSHLVQQARKVISDETAPDRSRKVEVSPPSIAQSSEETPSVAEIMASTSQEAQSQLTALAPALDRDADGRISEALDLTREFHDEHSVIQTALSAYETFVNSGAAEGFGPTQLKIGGNVFQSTLMKLAGIIGGKGTPYASVTPDSIILTTGVSSNGETVDMFL